MTSNSPEPFGSNESGFSLIEIVIAMFILALLALAFVPLLVQGMKQSAQNATVAIATQMVSEQLDLARNRTAPVLCSTIRGLQSVSVTPSTGGYFTDSRGVRLTVSRTAGTCPTAYPGTITFNAKAVRVDTGVTVAQLDTRIYVTGP